MHKAQVTFCGQGEANSGTPAVASKQCRDDFFLAAPVPPSTTWKSQAKGILSGLLYIKVKKKSQNIWAFPVNSGLLETAEHLCRAHQCWQARSSLPTLGKACDPGGQILPVAWDCIRKEKTLTGFAGCLLPERTWRAKARRRRLQPRSPADHPPPPGPCSQQGLVLPLVSSGNPSGARDRAQFES